jgi:hypothetical protein
MADALIADPDVPGLVRPSASSAATSANGAGAMR